MSYTVVWLESAESELAAIWNDAADREHVALAANEIDLRVRIRPSVEGESRTGNRRILLVAPLGVTFEVEADDRLVRVLEVWRFGPPARK